MKFNRDSVYILAVLYIFVTRYKEVQTEANTGNTEPALDPVCKPGTYPSVYVEDCAGCPLNWTFCKNEHRDEVNSCEKACGKLDI